MITNFKIFETISKPIKVGDYALIKIQYRGLMHNNLLCKFLTDYSPFKVKILNNDFKGEYLITNKNLICWSESKKELELLLNSIKYNL